MTLTEFLLARIAEDEMLANMALDTASKYDQKSLSWQWVALHDDGSRWLMTSHDPARVLAEGEAKRRIVVAHAGWHVCPNADGRGYTDHHDGSNPDDPDDELCPTLLALAATYA